MKAATVLPLVLLSFACGGGGGSAPPAEGPPSSKEPGAVDMPPASTGGSGGGPAASPAATPTASPASTAPPPQKIEFPPHASVEDATKAVPQGLPRMNMSDTVLQAPLLDHARYDKCKVPRTTKFSITVAVYDGAAVGVDVTTKPKNAKLEECLDGIVRSMTWDKVPSLNHATVTF